MSPRRSSRPRNTQPPPSVPSHSNSTSSVSSTRAERSTRSNNKQSSSQKSTTPQSLSSEEVDDPAHAPEAPQTRRSKRGQTNDEDDAAKVEDELEDDIEEEEEITRCVCGNQEYPGPPVELGKNNPAAPSINSDLQNDEAGSLFIQCDICKVWQHGGCVGIMDEAMSPEEYFCEECRTDFHKLMTGQRGQKYSRYLPVLEPPPAKPTRKSSFPKEPDRTSRNSDKKKAGTDAFTKRRSTMNSRGAYDDAEVLRMVIEQSKGDNATHGSDNGNRKGKRSRDDSSDDIKQDRKRQRTGSETPDPTSHTNTASLTAESDEEQLSAKANTAKKARAAAAKNQREKELKEKEKERERERAEQASKRSARAGRRRADASESPETAPPSSKPADDKSTKPEVLHSPDTPPPNPTSSNNPRKVTGRSSKRGGRLGRNQHTRDMSAAEAHDSPRNRANGDHDSLTNGNTSGGGEASSGGKGRTRNYNPHKTGWGELRRRATGMMEIISRIQVELAGEKTPPSAGSGVTSVKGTVAALSASSIPDQTEENAARDKDAPVGILEMMERDFKDLTSAEMMDTLTRSLTTWQKKYGKESEKV